MSNRRRKLTIKRPAAPPPTPAAKPFDFSSLAEIPETFSELEALFRGIGPFDPLALRKETMRRIERETGRPLLCYVAKTFNLQDPALAAMAGIEHADLQGFEDLVKTTPGEQADLFLASNGGSAEATERIVALLRSQYCSLRFIVPSNAYSAATLMCFSGDQVLMDQSSTLGPIDPQINGIPARAYLRAFRNVEERLKQEGPGALTAYLPLLSKYDLPLLEICKSAEELSRELAIKWLSEYMLKLPPQDPRIVGAINYFASFDTHKSHARSIGLAEAKKYLIITDLTAPACAHLHSLVRSLFNQHCIFFNQTAFVKLFENIRGTNWGRQAKTITFQVPQPQVPAMPFPAPQPGPPKESSEP